MSIFKDTSAPRGGRRVQLRIRPLALGAALLLAAFLSLIAGWQILTINRNGLALGEQGQADVVQVPLQPPAEFDGLSRKAIFDQRRAAIEQRPELLARPYRPSSAVFRQMEGGLPWWGLLGYYYYGSGERGIEGLSEEARFVLNPYLLVAADFYHDWRALPEAEVTRPGFPLDCPPTSLTWFPKDRRAEVVYSAACLSTLNSWAFDLLAYNARDLNLNYLYIPAAQLSNIAPHALPTAPYAILHYLHKGGSCGYPGGCNNTSPPTPELDALELTGFPAQIVIWLWENEPASLETPPDLVYFVYFR